LTGAQSDRESQPVAKINEIKEAVQSYTKSRLLNIKRGC
jgi:hypothetical protein